MKPPLILYVTRAGKALAEKLAPFLQGEASRYSASEVEKAFCERRPIVFIGACGIIVRAIGPHLKHKSQDPPVVVTDERGQFVISLLAGHLGGANELAKKIASFLGATPVITTASDVQGTLALDLWLQEKGAVLRDWGALKRLQSKLLEEGSLAVFLEAPLDFPLPEPLKRVEMPSQADLVLTYRNLSYPGPAFLLKALCLGMGFHDGERELYKKVTQALQREGLSPEAVRCIATLDKRAQNPAFSEMARRLSAEALSFEREKLCQISAPSPSYAQKVLQIPGVAEPCALLAAEGGPLVLPKISFQGVTLAAAIHASFTFR